MERLETIKVRLEDIEIDMQHNKFHPWPFLTYQRDRNHSKNVNVLQINLLKESI